MLCDVICFHPAKITPVFIGTAFSFLSNAIRVKNQLKGNTKTSKTTKEATKENNHEVADEHETGPLKGQCHEDFAVLGQFWAKIITLRLYSQTKCFCKATTKISNEFYQKGQFLEDFLKT